MALIVRVLTGTSRTPHDGRFIVAWDPHTPYGTLAVTSTSEAAQARRFATPDEIFREYATISLVQPRRPTDGGWNRPLRSLHLEILQE